MGVNCPCGSEKDYNLCCQPYHAGAAHAPTAEALMRSRYSAYVMKELPYLRLTLSPGEQATFDINSAREWAETADWLGLEILSASGAEADKKGRVEFIASYRQHGIEHTHREVSKFKRIGEQWYYVSGQVIPTIPAGITISRSAPCPCGSGKKYKRCCAVAAEA